MIFNSWSFIQFFLITFVLYLFAPHSLQNFLLLIASYVFYASWDVRFLSLIIITTLIDYFCGLSIHTSTSIKKRKLTLLISIISNLSILGFFKYYNFFIDSVSILLTACHLPFSIKTLNIILPVGISFYTFQTMSYTIDIYQKKLKPTKNIIDFALFVSFFPQLVAGPIERARHLIPQIQNKRTFSGDAVVEGSFLILLGFFQKIYIADNLANIVDPVFNTAFPANGIHILLATYAFAFQIYCDFAGYSNIARGIARLLGFELMVNFNAPYWASNPHEFWKRWHISLSLWLRDYVYIPLGGNIGSRLKHARNVLITMFLGGLWHGASWQFIIWGLYHGLLIILYRPFTNKQASSIKLTTFSFIQKIVFFHLVCLGWIFFRSHSLQQSFTFFLTLFNDFTFAQSSGLRFMAENILLFTMPIIIINIIQIRQNDPIGIFKESGLIRYSIYTIMIFLIIFLGATGHEEFLYFQF